VIHPVAWLAWVSAMLVTLSMTRNPLYLGLILVWIAFVTIAIRPLASATSPIPISPVRFALVVVTLSTVFNGITVHVGRTVLFRLPGFLPILGGIITLEALAFGFLNGVVLSGIFAAFTVLNRVLPIQAIVRLIPQAFYPVAVVVSIAVSFVPATLHQFQQIRQAQAVRGHRVRGLRDWLPLIVPLLVGGLERALQLAEAMTARGFASTDTQRANSVQAQGTIIAGLILLLGGWLLRLMWGQALLGLTVLLTGVGLIGGTVWLAGRQVPRTVYRPQPWARNDWSVVLGAGVTAMTFLFSWPGLDRSSIFYYPYPTLVWPGFHPILAVATLGLLVPGLLLLRQRNDTIGRVLRRMVAERA